MERIYLDDVRTPTGDNWIVVRNYDEFVSKVNEIGLANIDIISLDHDLGDTAMNEYFNNVSPNYELNYERIPEKTGMDCARFLVAESMNTKIPLPTIYIHSANPIGSANMIGYINNYFRNCKLPEVCMKVNIEHTYSEGTHMSEEERNKRYMILDKYKTK